MPVSPKTAPIGDPLNLDGWLEWNAAKWGLKPERIQLRRGAEGSPVLSTVLYLDKRGRGRHPALNPYIPLSFRATNTNQPARIARQWSEMSGLLALEYLRRGVRRATFAPDVQDVREFQWRGYLAEVRYTYYLTLPVDLDRVDTSVRGYLTRAARKGYRCDRSASFADVMDCLEQSEVRQGFSHHLERADLDLLSRLLGESVARFYVCYAPNGEPASALIVLLDRDLAVGWVGGTDKAHFSSGVTTLTAWYAFDDLRRAGATRFDYAGANIRSIASAKSNWNGKLTPYYALAAVDPRTIGSLYLRARRFRKTGS